LEPEALHLLAVSGVSVPPFALVTDPAELARLPAPLRDGPVAIKIVSKDILHKSDVGGVRLNLSGPAIAEGVAAMREAIASRMPDADVSGVLVTPMAPRGVEVILGVTTDPQYGKIMLFGLGGVFVEVLKDVSFRSLPLSRADAEEMLEEIKGKAVLDGVRGGGAADREALIALMLKISAIVLAHPEIVEVDINPVILGASGTTIADARILLA
jgi:acetyltransferase